MKRKRLGNTPIPHHREGIHRIDRWLRSQTIEAAVSQNLAKKTSRQHAQTEENILQM
jgi:hypothetical protein